MIHRAHHVLRAVLFLAVITPAALAQSIDLRLPDGSRWRGQVSDFVEVRYVQQNIEVTIKGTIVEAGDLYLMIEGEVAGQKRTRTIFRSDLRAIRTIDRSETGTEQEQRDRPGEGPRRDRPDDEPANNSAPGVFYMPMKGGVGVEIRRQELQAIAEEADRHGPGQIIVLHLDTPGGSAHEMEQMGHILARIRRDHRLVAWVHEAISAGCAIAINCNEIYFTTAGRAGAMTAFNPGTGQSVQGEELQRYLELARGWANATGVHPYVIDAMIHVTKRLSYDKDERTGEVTFYNNLSGQYKLSTGDENLLLTSSQAVHCGFARGIADTTDDLAKLLDMPEWREVNDYGRRIQQAWHRMVERARQQVPRLLAQYQYGSTGSGDAREVLGRRISIIEDLIRWWDRAPQPMAAMGAPRKEALERQLRELRRQMELMIRRERQQRR